MNNHNSRRPDDGVVDWIAIRGALTGHQPDTAAALTNRELWEAVCYATGRGRPNSEIADALGISIRHVERIRSGMHTVRRTVVELQKQPAAAFARSVAACLRNWDEMLWLALTGPELVARTRRALVLELANIPNREAAARARCGTQEGRLRAQLDTIRVIQERLEWAVDVLAVRARELAVAVSVDEGHVYAVGGTTSRALLAVAA